MVMSPCDTRCAPFGQCGERKLYWKSGICACTLPACYLRDVGASERDMRKNATPLTQLVAGWPKSGTCSSISPVHGQRTCVPPIRLHQGAVWCAT